MVLRYWFITSAFYYGFRGGCVPPSENILLVFLTTSIPCRPCYDSISCLRHLEEKTNASLSNHKTLQARGPKSSPNYRFPKHRRTKSSMHTRFLSVEPSHTKLWYHPTSTWRARWLSLFIFSPVNKPPACGFRGFLLLFSDFSCSAFPQHITQKL